MKKVRLGFAIVFCTISLTSCTGVESLLRLNPDIFSLDAEKNKDKAASADTQEYNAQQQTEALSTDLPPQPLQFFKPQQTQPYRQQAEKVSLQEEQQREKPAKTIQKLKQNARALNTDGRLPQGPKIDRSEHPQVVNERGQIQSPDEIVQLDYEQVEIRQILEELADALGMSIVIDPSISGKITMRTSPNQPLRNRDLWAVLNMLLNESGITLEKKAGLYYAKKAPLNIPDAMGYPSLIQSDDVSLALQITPLKYLSVEAALTAIKPIVGNKTRISQLGTLNMLAITASVEQLSRINGLLKLIDSDPFQHRGLRLYKIKEAEVKELARELEDVLKLIEGNASSYKVLGLERINALLVVAPPKRGFASVDRWVQILDEGGDEALQEQVFIYNCKSVKCDKLANTLNSVFGSSAQNRSRQSKESYSDRKKGNVFKKVPKDKLNVKNKSAKNIKKSVRKPDNKKNRPKNSADVNVTIVADEDTNSLVVRSTGKDYKTLLQTIQLLDKTPLQVLINVVIAQVSLKKGQSLGLDWKFDDGTTLLQNNLGKASEVVDGKPLGLIWSATNNNFSATINALAEDGDINILSRPSLLIANNQEGVINVGKEVPVQTSATTNLNATTIVDGDNPATGTQVTQEIAYRNTGIELTVTPHINEDGIVNLEIKQSLSAIEGSTTSQDAAFKPTFSNQDINTVAVVADGETIVLGGLIDTVTTYKDSGIPFLKDIPFAGYLFKTMEESEDRRELMLIITPRVIGPNTDLEQFGQEFSSRFNAVGRYIDAALKNQY